jgi:rSAM/selenodomain-associated transferase 2
MASETSLSIIVPVLNEEELLGEFLQDLRRVAPFAEIIVVDGGSRDATRVIAKGAADIVLAAPRGRALQMNAGAATARGEVLWFLHADVKVPGSAVADIAAAMRDPRVVGGCFRLRFPPRPVVYRISDSLGNLGVEICGFTLGDHGIFCRRTAFAAAGRYRNLPILEDAELSRALRKLGRTVQLRAAISCSPRTFEKRGPWRTTLVYFSILALYVLGVPISALHRIYCWFAEDAPRDLVHATL